MLDRPGAALRAKIREREALQRHTRLDLPGDPLLARGIDWSKQNLADSVQEARDLELREINAGKNYPPPKGTLARARFIGAGFPDYPWLFATDGEYTAFASVALGQFEPIKEHLRALRDASPHHQRRQRQGRPRGRHRRLGLLRRQRRRGQHRRDRQVPERRRADLALDRRRRLPRRDVRLREVEPASTSTASSTTTATAGPRASATSSGAGMGEEKLDNTTATIRGLRDLADLAEVQGRRRDRDVGGRKAADLEARFEARVVDARDPAARRLARRPRQRAAPAAPLDRRHADGDRDRARRPGRARPDHRRARQRARSTCARRRATATTSGSSTRATPGCDAAQSDRPGEQQTFTLNTSIMAVGEGNYGRLGPDQQQRFTTANRRLQLPDPTSSRARCRRSRPSPDYSPTGSIDQQVHRARDGAAGVGQLRHRVAGRAPAARRAARRSAAARSRSCRRCRATAAHRGLARSASATRARRRSRASRSGKTYTHPRAGRRADLEARDRPHAARGRDGRDGRARRQGRDAGDARRRTAGSRSRSPPARARTRWW